MNMAAPFHEFTATTLRSSLDDRHVDDKFRAVMQSINSLLLALSTMKQGMGSVYSAKDVEMLHIVLHDCLHEALINVIEHASHTTVETTKKVAKVGKVGKLSKVANVGEGDEGDEGDDCKEDSFWIQCLDQMFNVCAQLIGTVHAMVPTVTQHLASSMLDHCFGGIECLVVLEKWMNALVRYQPCGLTHKELMGCIAHVEKNWLVDEMEDKQDQQNMLDCLQRVLMNAKCLRRY